MLTAGRQFYLFRTHENTDRYIQQLLSGGESVLQSLVHIGLNAGLELVLLRAVSCSHPLCLLQVRADSLCKIICLVSSAGRY